MEMLRMRCGFSSNTRVRMTFYSTFQPTSTTEGNGASCESNDGQRGFRCVFFFDVRRFIFATEPRKRSSNSTWLVVISFRHAAYGVRSDSICSVIHITRVGVGSVF